MSLVLLPLSNGFEEVEAISLIDVLRRGGVGVRVAYVGDNEMLVGANNITIKAEVSLSDINSEDFDMILLAGGWENTYTLAKDLDTQRLLKEFNSQNKLVGAMCASIYALKQADVLGNEYTCYPSAVDEINHKGYRDDKAVVEDGNIITSQGPGTALCFGLEILKKLKDEDTYKAVKDGMLLGFCS